MTRSAKILLAAGMSLQAILLGAPNCADAADLVRVGDVPLMCGGAFYVARAKGYFKKLNLEIETRRFYDSSAAVAAVIAGELDLALLPSDARLFNTVAKGAPLAVILDGGHNRRGFGATVINVTQALHEDGVLSVRDFARLKGKRFGVPAAGSVGHYNAALSLIKAALDPAKDVQWVMDVSQPELMRMLGRNELEAVDLTYQLGLLAQSNKWGPIIINDDVIVPDGPVSIVAAQRDFLTKRRDAAVRFALGYLRAITELNAAAIDPGPHPDIVDILAQNGAVHDADLVRSTAPNWCYIAEDGAPLVNSIMDVQDFWSGKHFSLVEKKVSRQQLFDLNVAKDAKARLRKEKPFGN